MPALSNSYIEFLFNSDGTLKERLAPKVSYQAYTDSFVLKYSIPGYHTPRQYFSFLTIPEIFPNQYVAEIFRVFSITNSFLYRHPHNTIPNVKKSIIRDFFGLNKPEQIYSEDEIESAEYNLQLAIKLGREHHSLFYFDSFLEAYKILHPEIKRYSKNVVRRIQIEFNRAIS